MEDSLTEDESLLPPLNLNPKDGSKREDNEAKEDGFVSTGTVEEEKEEKNLGEEHRRKDFVAKDEAKGSGGGGGLINNLISTLVTPLSPRTGRATERESGNGVLKSEKGAAADGGDGEQGGGDNGREGGLISNLVSSFFHQTEAQGVVENEKDKEEEGAIVDSKIKRVKTENGANGGGGIIQNIVSHFPASLHDDAVPTADEATLLINSLVHD